MVSEVLPLPVLTSVVWPMKLVGSSIWMPLSALTDRLLAMIALPIIWVTGPAVDVRPTIMPGALITPVILMPPLPVTSRLPPAASVLAPIATEPRVLKLVAFVLLNTTLATLVLARSVRFTSPCDAPATNVKSRRPKLMPDDCTRL